MDESHNLRSLPPLATRAGAVLPFRAMRIGAQADMMIAAGVDVIKLNLGQPDYDAPEPVRTAMRDLYDGRALPYTEAKGLPELRRKISEFYATQHQVNVDPGRIVITAGGSTALLLAVALTVDAGSEVLIADPSYPTNRELVRAFEGVVVDVPTSAATRFHLTPELLDKYWSERTRAVMITSPSNPTGTTITPDTLRAVCDAARAHDAWRIVDETYLDLADVEPDGSRVPSVLSIDPDAIVCSSFSKYFGMTGCASAGSSCRPPPSTRWTTSRRTSSSARTRPPRSPQSRRSATRRSRSVRSAGSNCSPGARS